MASTLITTTPRAAMDPQRYQGILVSDSYAQITSSISKALSPEHALFFAEPFQDSGGEAIDWYTNAQGPLVNLMDLPPDALAAAEARIQSLASDIEAEARQLIQSGEPSKSIRGNILLMALRYPGREYIFMAGEQPVLTGWGFLPASAESTPEELIRLGLAAPKPAVASPAANGNGAPPKRDMPKPYQMPGVPEPRCVTMLRALMPVLAGLSLFLCVYLFIGMVLANMGIHPRTFFESYGGCSRSADAPEQVPALSDDSLLELRAEQEKALSLQRRIEELRRQLALRAMECPKTPASLPEPEPVVEEPPLLSELLPTTPEVIPEKTAPAEKPKEQPRQETPPKERPAPPQKQAQGEDLKIPDNAARDNDLSFLEGCWDSETGLYNSRTGEPIKVKYCFDGNGSGTRTIFGQENNDRCVGPVRAKFSGSGALVINADGASCSKGGGFYGQDVNCTQGAGNKAQCTGKERGGKKNTWKARFKKS